MGDFKKGRSVVKILSGAGLETASIDTVLSVKQGVVTLCNTEHTKYDAKTGRALENTLPGWSTRLIELEEST
jgi:hypothetical protein